jgi:hypothetical protein
MLSLQNPKNIELLRRDSESFKEVLLLIMNPVVSEDQIQQCFLVGRFEFWLSDLFFDFHY